MNELNLLIIEDNRLLCDGLKAMIEKQSDFNVETASGNGENIPKMIAAQKTDVLLMDVSLPEHDSFSFLKSLKGTYPQLKIILMGILPIDDEAIQYIEAGVSGFILKDATLDDFMKTIRAVASGEKVLPVSMTKSLFSMIIGHGMQKYGESKLVKSIRMTKREREVVALIADGLTNKEIAHTLHLSAYTVKSHVHNILEKMALNTRVQIAIYAHESKDFDTSAVDNPSNDD